MKRLKEDRGTPILVTGDGTVVQTGFVAENLGYFILLSEVEPQTLLF